MEQQTYHRAKQWEIAFFSLNNSATNIYLIAFGFLTYYATGVMGLATFTVVNLMGLARLFDGLIDPTIGVMIDRTNTRFGKYRPYMVIGNVMLVLSFLILFNTHHVTGAMQFVVYVFALIFHKIGYSLQQTVTKAAQPVLTNDPKQRPLFSIYDTIFSSVCLFSGGQMFISQYLTPKNGGINLGFINELNMYVMCISAVITVLAVIGISRKDRPEYYGLGAKTVETKTLKDYWSVIKGNRPLITLVLSAGIMKFVAQLFSDATFQIMLFGIVLGNYGLSGTFSMYQIIPNVLMIFLFTKLATQKGMRYVYNGSLIVGLAAVVLSALILFVQNGSGNITQLFTGNWSLMAWAFMALFIVARITLGYPSGASLVMTADITNYETARSGRYVSGLIGTVFSFVDSITSSLVPVVVGWVCVAIGYVKDLPKPTEALTTDLFNGTLLIYGGLVTVGALVALILGRMYPLTKERMAEIQLQIEALKQEKA